MPKTTIFDPDSTKTKNANHAAKPKSKLNPANQDYPRKSLPKDVSLLGEGFNYLYKAWYALLENVSKPDNDQTTENPRRVDDLVDLSLAELHCAQLDRKKNSASEEDKLPQRINNYFPPEFLIWRGNYCKIHLLLDHLHSKDRIDEIAKSDEHPGKSVAYIEPTRIADTLMYALALSEFANANEMAASGNINEMVNSIYEASYAQTMSTNKTAKSVLRRQIKAEKSNNGKKGASIRANKFSTVKAYALELASSMDGKSANHIAHKIKDLVMIKARSLNAALSEENAQKTIQKYILAHRNKSL